MKCPENIPEISLDCNEVKRFIRNEKRKLSKLVKKLCVLPEEKKDDRFKGIY